MERSRWVLFNNINDLTIAPCDIYWRILLTTGPLMSQLSPEKFAFGFLHRQE